MTREENLHWLNQEIRTWENECQSKHPIKEALYAARKALEQEPREGHWIDIKNKNGTVIAVRCSKCGNSPKHAIKSDFCPNCGADMREVEDGKEM